VSGAQCAHCVGWTSQFLSHEGIAKLAGELQLSRPALSFADRHIRGSASGHMSDMELITDARILSTVLLNIVDAEMHQSRAIISRQTRSAEAMGWGQAPQAGVMWDYLPFSRFCALMVLVRAHWDIKRCATGYRASATRF
jgi:hypothetical protein